jgi:hypothetical protein
MGNALPVIRSFDWPVKSSQLLRDSRTDAFDVISIGRKVCGNETPEPRNQVCTPASSAYPFCR